jgi:predicted transcriptional regulator
MKRLANTLKQHEIECDKCGGSGKNYAPSIAEFLKFWRTKEGVPQRTMAILMKQDVSRLCRFEGGKESQSEQAIRRYIAVLQDYLETRNG